MSVNEAMGEIANLTPRESESAPKGTVKRILAVLLAFEQDEPQLPLSEVARRAGLPTSTVLRLLRELCAARLLERTDNNKYQVGARLFELGMRAPVPKLLREVAMPVMEDLYAATRENVHLGMMDGLEILIIQQFTGTRSVRTPAHSGARVPAHSTGNGKALLAFSAPEVIEAVLASELPPITEHTICSSEVLRHQLDEIRERGFSVSREENSLGTLSVGAPILGLNGYAVAALSLVVRRSPTTDVQRFAHAVQTAANTIARIWARTQPFR